MVERDVFPSPASSHSDSTSRIERPRTKPPITSALSGSVLSSRLQCHFGNNFDTNGKDRSTRLRDLDPQLTLSRLHMPGPEPIAQPRVVVTQSALALGPALVASPTEPLIELVLDRPLDDQSGTEPTELAQQLLRVIDHALR